MKMIAAIGLGLVLSFGLTIVGASLATNFTSIRFLEIGVLCPLIALAVGASAGLVVRKRARIAAALSLAPWAIWLVLATNAGHSTISRWVTTTAVVSVYFALGVGAAGLLSRRMGRYSIRGGRSQSQEHS